MKSSVYFSSVGKNEEFLEGISEDLIGYRNNRLGLVVYICNPSTGDVDAEGS